MNKSEDIDSILLANWYLLTCKEKNTNLARKYLTMKIDKALSKKHQSIKPNDLPNTNSNIN